MIYIRTDANEIIATGHLMRCLTIAEAIVMRGEEVCFVVSDQNALSMIEERGFSYIITGSEWNHVDSQAESKLMGQYLCSDDWVLVDSYYLRNDYIMCMCKLCCVATFDDMYEEKKDADIIINYNMFYRNFDYDKRYENSGSTLLLGESYVPLRSQFREIIPLYTVRQCDVPRVLIMCGGGDLQGFIYQCLEYMMTQASELFERLEWCVVIGNYYPDRERLKQLCDCWKNINIYENVKEMATVMKKCDLCITAASTVLYECCAMLLPTFFVLTSEDQQYDAEYFGKDHRMEYCGNFMAGAEETLERIAETLREDMFDGYRLQDMKNKMKNLIDGQGAIRIAEALTGDTKRK